MGLIQQHERRVMQYVDDVIDERVNVGELERLGVERYITDTETASERGLFFDHNAASLAIEFMECLRHSKGRWYGQPLHLEGWQAFAVWNVYGWKRHATLARRFTRAYTQVARKNGKSTMCGAIALLGFAADGEMGAEVYSAATKRDQAMIVFDQSKKMVKADPHLRQIVRVINQQMVIRNTESIYKPLGANADSTDGLNAHLVIVDELHAHRDRKLYDVLDTAEGARLQPLIWSITTAGNDSLSICREIRDNCESILRGSMDDDEFFANIFEPDEGDDWKDESTWRKGNPNIGVTVTHEYLRRKVQRAEGKVAAERNVKQKNLDHWVEAAFAWMGHGRNGSLATAVTRHPISSVESVTRGWIWRRVATGRHGRWCFRPTKTAASGVCCVACSSPKPWR